MNTDKLLNGIDKWLSLVDDEGLKELLTDCKQQIQTDAKAVEYTRSMSHRGDFLGDKARESLNPPKPNGESDVK